MSIIQTRALTKRYARGVTALSELTVDVAPGITGLVGANGAGKSTLIKILLGLLPPTDGQVRVLGLDPVRQGQQVRARVGYMPEHDCLPGDVSAAEFVTHLARMSGLPATVARERASEALRHVGLYEERYRQIGGYSTGMKQRVKLAQALVHDPELLLLDEPTNGLDPAGRQAMLTLIARIGGEFGISVVVCSHLLGEIEQICASLVAIDGGRLLRATTVSAVTGQGAWLAVEVEDGLGDGTVDGTAALAATLAGSGLETDRDGRTLLVRLAGESGGDADESADDAVYDAVRDAVVGLDLALHRMERRRHHVADLFRTTSADDVTPRKETVDA